jgi:hypothetical protein
MKEDDWLRVLLPREQGNKVDCQALEFMSESREFIEFILHDSPNNDIPLSDR